MHRRRSFFGFSGFSGLSGILVLGAVACLADCTSFAPIAKETCGNHVIDPGEDCDGFSRGTGTACGAVGTTSACRLTCSYDPGGSTCPTGWGCGADGVCRAPTGKFSRLPEPIVAGAWRVSLADFDGDHRQDVLTRGLVDARGFSKLRAHFFDANMGLAATTLLPTKVGSPVTRDMDGDKLADIVFTLSAIDATLSGIVSGAVGVTLGQRDRTFSPVAYPTFVFADTTALMFPITGFPGFPMRVLVFGQGPGGSALLHPDVSTGAVGLMAPLPDGPNALAGTAVGKVIETSPCDDLVWAYTGKGSASVMAPCKRDVSAWVWNDGGSPIDIPLPAGVTVDAGVRIGDVNSDGHLDVLIGAGGRTYVAYGDGRGGFSTLDQPFGVPVITVKGAPPSAYPIPFPLAVGDVSGDGKLDYVTPQLVLTSVKGDPNGSYVPAFYKTPGAWTTAAVADFNGNGLPDIVAGSSSDLDLDFLNGTGTVALNPFTIPTNSTPSNFAVGDVDGDLLPDLVLAESTPNAEDQLAIVFGKPNATPDPPVAIGRLGTIVQTGTFNPGAALDSIAVISHSIDPADHSVRISLLAGSGDRQPLAPFALSTTNQTGGVPFNVVTGAFAKDPNVDFVALAADPPATASLPFSTFRLWLAAATGPAKFQTSTLSDPLPVSLRPLVGAASSQRAAALMASGDIDGDGVAEIVSVMPSDKDMAAIVVAKPKSDGKGGFVMNAAAPIGLPFSIGADGAVALGDVDGDGALDLVLLGGRDPMRQLMVMWNDGMGGFTPMRAITLNAAGEQPSDFAFVRAAAAALPAIAYVTHKSLVLAAVATDRTTVTRTVLETALSYATGVGGGDIDGDGVDDLAVTDTPSLILYRGQPVLK